MDGTTTMTRLMLPTALAVRRPVEARASRVTSLDGQRVGVFRNGRVIMPRLAAALETELRSLGADVVHWRMAHSEPTEPDVLDRLASEVTAAIVGLGN
jgi:protoheme ferro-lyase